MRTLALFLFASLFTSGCSLNLKPEITPTLTVGSLPPSSGGPGGGTGKALIANLTVSSDITAASPWQPSNNCVQLVEMGGQNVIVEFSNEACPASGLARAESVRFTATYTTIRTAEYELSGKDSTGRTSKIGRMYLDENARTLTLMELCTENYQTYCYVGVSLGKMTTLIIF